MPPTAELPEVRIEPMREATSPPCRCCGTTTRRVWGEMLDTDAGSTVGFYYVVWCPERPTSAGLYLVIGRWEDGTTAADRVVVTLDASVRRDRLRLRVVNGGRTPWEAALAGQGRVLRAVEAMARCGHLSVALCTEIERGDPRVAALVAEMRAATAALPAWRRWRAGRPPRHRTTGGRA